MQDPREKIQQEARESWLRSERKNTIIVGTGGGKSKITIDLIKELDPLKILLVTNSEDLRDKNWKVEFEKFGAMGYWENTESECYQTMYKRTGEWDLIVFDEIDFACSPEFGKCLSQHNLKSKWVIGLTGFITQEKEQFLEYYYPICYKAETNELQEAGALNKSRFLFVEFPLSKAKTIKQKKKDGSFFMVSENDQYRYYDKEFQKAMIVKAGIEKKYRDSHQSLEDKPDWKAADWRYKICASKRKAILNKLDSSVRVVHSILGNLERVDKALIISALTEQCDKFPSPYHGKVKHADNVMNDLNYGIIKVMSVVKKINRGVNLVGVNNIIFESFDGSETEFNQRHGRGLRLDPNQTLNVIILVPMYEDLVRTPNGAMMKQLIHTQASRWADKMTQSFVINEQKTIRLTNNYEINTLW